MNTPPPIYKDQRANWVSFLAYMSGGEKVNDIADAMEYQSAKAKRLAESQADAEQFARELIAKFRRNDKIPQKDFHGLMDRLRDGLSNRWASAGSDILHLPSLQNRPFIHILGPILSAAAVIHKRKFGLNPDLEGNCSNTELAQKSKEIEKKIDEVLNDILGSEEGMVSTSHTLSACVDALLNVATAQCLLLAEVLTATEALDNARKQG